MADRKISACTEATVAATGDIFPVVDISEASDANKNKKITYTNLLRGMPDGTASTPTVGWTSDSGESGFYRESANTIGITIDQTRIGSLQSNGLSLGTGTPSAQLHLFSTSASDQVIIENSEAGATAAPDFVLYRNSASPAASDQLGNLVFRGEDSGGGTHDYASVVGQIETTTNGSEDGILDLMSSASGTLASRVRLRNNKVGLHEANPLSPVHLTNTSAGISLRLECSANSASTGSDVRFFRHRGGTTAAQDNDLLSTLFFRGKNDASGTPEEIDYCAIESKIIDASDSTEDGQINLKVMDGGTLTTQLSIDANLLTIGDAVNIAANTSTGTKIGTATTQKLGLWNVTPVVQPSAIGNITTTASSGTLPTPNDAVTIANAASPTNVELLEYCVELESKLEAALAALRAVGVIAT